jgi:hypothetical protein
MFMRNLLRSALVLGLIVFSSVSVLAATPASCTPNLTSCSITENVLLQLPFLAISGDVVVQDPNSATVSDVFRIFNDFADTGGGTGLGRLAILYSRDDNTQLPDPSTYSANAVFIKESASGSTSYSGNGTTFSLDTSAVTTRLVYSGDVTANYHDAAQLKAVLTVLGTGAAIPNASVQFTLGSQACVATTDATGTASCGVVLSQAAGAYAVGATFGGVFGVDAGTSVSTPFSISLEETAVSYTGDTVIANGGTAHLSGVLLEDNVTPIAGRTVTFTLGAGSAAQSCNGTTDASGKASCTISPVAQALGPTAVGDTFAGDHFYRPMSANANAILFAYPTGGGFVLGDRSAQPGARETFWGPRWTADNQLSGGLAPDSFKGFAENLSSDPAKCGIAWTSAPGNSSDPPSGVPAYMGVLVSPSVTKSGSKLSGNVTRIVVVRTDDGYDGNPGHAGTGIVVADVCR